MIQKKDDLLTSGITDGNNENELISPALITTRGEQLEDQYRNMSEVHFYADNDDRRYKHGQGLVDVYKGRDDSFLNITSDEDIASLGLSSEELSNLTQEELDEYKSQDQSFLGNIYRGGARTVNKFLGEALKMAGTVGGVIGYLGEGLFNEFTGTEDSEGQRWDESWIFNNDFNNTIDASVNYLNNVEGFAGTKVYVPEDVKNGGLLKNLFSSSFWATEGADGVGFLASMFLPVGALKAAKFGKGIVQGGKIGNKGLAASEGGMNFMRGTNKISNALTRKALRKTMNPPSTQLKNTINKVGSNAEKLPVDLKLAAKNIDNATGVLLNTTFEAAAEGSEVYQHVYDDLIKKNYDKDTAKKIAADRSSATFRTNFGILLVPNAIENRLLFGSSRGNKGMLKNILKKSPSNTKGVVDKTKNILINPIKHKAGVAGKMLKIGAMEGLWEEGVQFATGEYYMNKPTEEEADFLQDVSGVIKSYVNNFDNIDMQKGMALGSILGGVMGGFGAYKEYKNARDIIEGTSAKKEIKVAGLTLREDKDARVGLREQINKQSSEIKKEDLISDEDLASYREGTIDNITKLMKESMINPKESFSSLVKTDEEGNVLLDRENGLQFIVDEKKIADHFNTTGVLFGYAEMLNKEMLEGEKALYTSILDRGTYNVMSDFLNSDAGVELYKEEVLKDKAEQEVIFRNRLENPEGNETKAKAIDEQVQDKIEELTKDIDDFKVIKNQLDETRNYYLPKAPSDKKSEEYKLWQQFAQKYSNTKIDGYIKARSYGKVLNEYDADIFKLEEKNKFKKTLIKKGKNGKLTAGKSVIEHEDIYYNPKNPVLEKLMEQNPDGEFFRVTASNKNAENTFKNTIVNKEHLQEVIKKNQKDLLDLSTKPKVQLAYENLLKKDAEDKLTKDFDQRVNIGQLYTDENGDEFVIKQVGNKLKLYKNNAKPGKFKKFTKAVSEPLTIDSFQEILDNYSKSEEAYTFPTQAEKKQAAYDENEEFIQKNKDLSEANTKSIEKLGVELRELRKDKIKNKEAIAKKEQTLKNKFKRERSLFNKRDKLTPLKNTEQTKEGVIAKSDEFVQEREASETEITPQEDFRVTALEKELDNILASFYENETTIKNLINDIGNINNDTDLILNKIKEVITRSGKRVQIKPGELSEDFQKAFIEERNLDPNIKFTSDFKSNVSIEELRNIKANLTSKIKTLEYEKGKLYRINKRANGKLEYLEGKIADLIADAKEGTKKQEEIHGFKPLTDKNNAVTGYESAGYNNIQRLKDKRDAIQKNLSSAKERIGILDSLISSLKQLLNNLSKFIASFPKTDKTKNKSKRDAQFYYKINKDKLNKLIEERGDLQKSINSKVKDLVNINAELNAYQKQAVVVFNDQIEKNKQAKNKKGSKKNKKNLKQDIIDKRLTNQDEDIKLDSTGGVLKSAHNRHNGSTGNSNFPVFETTDEYENGKVKDEKELRWTNFINTQDIVGEGYKGKAFLLSQLPTEMKDFYTKWYDDRSIAKESAVFVFMVDKDGKFLDGEGNSLTKDFQKINLSKYVFTNLANPATIKESYYEKTDSSKVKKIKKEYSKNRNRVIRTLGEENGEVFIPILSKSRGIQRNPGKEGLFFDQIKSLNEYFEYYNNTVITLKNINDHLEIIIAKGETNVPGSEIKLSDGFVYIKDKRTGNLYPVQPKQLEVTDMDDLYSILEYVSKNKTLKVKNDNKTQLNENKQSQPDKDLTVVDLLKNKFYTEIKSDKSVAIYPAKDKDGVIVDYNVKLFGKTFKNISKDSNLSAIKNYIDEISTSPNFNIFTNVFSLKLDDKFTYEASSIKPDNIEVKEVGDYRTHLFKTVLQSDLAKNKPVEYLIHEDYSGTPSKVKKYLPVMNNQYVVFDMHNTTLKSDTKLVDEKEITDTKPETNKNTTKTKTKSEITITNLFNNNIDKVEEDEPIDSKGSADEYFRFKNNTNGEVWDRATELKWLEENIGVDYHVLNLINKGVWGQFKNSMIYLDENAREGTAYHEAFHAVTQLYLSKQERQELYNDFKNNYKGQSHKTYGGDIKNVEDFTDKEAEEYLADAFIDYKLFGKKFSDNISPKTLNFFQKLINILKNLIRKVKGVENNTIDQLFKNIDSGKFSYTAPSKSDVVLNKVAYQSLDDYNFNTPGFTHKAMNNLGFFYIMSIKDNFGTYDNFYTQLTQSDNSNKVMDTVMEGVENNLIKLKSVLKNEKSSKSIDFLLSQFENGKNQELLGNYLKILGLNELNEEYLNETLNEQDQVKDTSFNKGERVFNINPLHNSNSFVKLILSSLPKMVHSQGSKLDFTLDSEFGLIEMENMDTLYGRLLHITKGLDGVDNIVQALIDSEESILGLKFLNSPKLLNLKQVSENGLDSLEPDKALEVLQLVQSLTKSENIYQASNFTEGVEFNIIRLNEERKIRSVKLTWESNGRAIIANDPNYMLNGRIYNKDKFKNYLKVQSHSNYSEAFKFLKALGIKFTNEDLIIEEDKKRSADVRGTDSILVKKAIQMLRLINNEGQLFMFEQGVATNVKKDLNYFAELEYVADQENRVSTSYLNKDNKQDYIFTDKTFLSTIIDQFNNFETRDELIDAYDHLNPEHNSYLFNSTWFKEGGLLYDENGNKINDISLIINRFSRNSEDNTTSEYKNLSDGDKLTDLYNRMMLDNQVNLLKVGDSSIERFIQLPSLIDVYYDNELNINPTHKRNILDIFTGYLKDEMVSVLDNLEILEDSNTKEVYNNSFEKDGSLFNGVMLDLLEQLEEFNPTLSEFNKLVKKVLSPKTIINKNSNATNRDLIDSFFTNSNNNMDLDVFEDSMFNFLKRKTSEITSYMEELGLVEVLEKFDEDGNLAYKNNSLGADLTSEISTRTFETQVMKFVINDMVSNIEQTKILFGNPNQYGDVSKMFKRLKASQGPIKKAFNNRSVDSLIKSKFKRLDKGETIVDSNGKIIIKQLVIDDIFVKSNQITEESFTNDISNLTSNKTELTDYQKRLVDSYSDIEIADGNSWITLDFLRDFLYRTGDWGFGKNSMEDLYQWEMQHYYGNIYPDIFKDHWGRTWDGVVRDPKSDRIIRSKPDRVFNSLKPSGFGPYANESGHNQSMLKTGFAILLPSIATLKDVNNDIKYPNYKNMMDIMSKNGVSIMSMTSATKGALTKIRKEAVNKSKDPTVIKSNGLYGDNNYIDESTIGKPSNLDEQAHKMYQYLHYEFLGVQVDTGSKFKGKNKGGSQMTKLIFNSVLSKMNDFRQDTKLKDDINLLNILNGQKIELGKKELLDKLGLNNTDTQETVDLSKIKNILKKEAANRDLPDNIISQIDNLDETLGLDPMVQSDQFDYILMSMAEGFIVRQTRNGQASYQVPSIGFETYSKENDTLKFSNDLRFYEAVNKNGETVIESMEILLPDIYNGKVDIGNLTDERLIKILGFRIPTQGLASIESIKIKGFLPKSAGNVVILPADIVKKSGSDYDIDKLNLFIPNSYLLGREYKYIEGSIDKETGKMNVDVEYSKYISNIKEHIRDNFLNTLFNNLDDIVKEETEDSYLVKDVRTIKNMLSGDNLKQKNFLYDLVNNFLKSVKNTEKVEDVIDKLNTSLDSLISEITDINPLEYEDFSEEVKRVVLKSLNRMKLAMDPTSYLEEIADIDNQLSNLLTKDIFKKQAIENSMTETYGRLLTEPKIFEDLITPLDDDFLKVQSNKLYEVLHNEKRDSNKFNLLLDRKKLLTMHRDFTASTDGIGVSAVSSTFQTLAQLYDISFANVIATSGNKKFIEGGYNSSLETISYAEVIVPTHLNFSRYNKKKGKTHLGGRESVDGRSIQRTLAVVGNAVLDAIKDPYFAEGGGIRKDNLGTFLTLVMSGVKVDQVLAFLNQPIIEDYRKERANAFSTVNKVNGKFVSTVDIIKKVIKTHSDEAYLSSKDDSPSTLLEDLWKDTKAPKYGSKLIDNIKKRDSLQKTEGYKKQQAQILADYLRYELMANEVRELIQDVFTYDTKVLKTPKELAVKDVRTKRSLNSDNFVNLDYAVGRKKVDGGLVSFVEPYMTEVRNLLDEYKPLYGYLKDGDFEIISEKFMMLYNNTNQAIQIDKVGNIFNKFVTGYYLFNMINNDYKLDNSKEVNFIDNINKELSRLFVTNSKQKSTIAKIKDIKSNIEQVESGKKVLLDNEIQDFNTYGSNKLLQLIEPIINSNEVDKKDNLVMLKNTVNVLESNEITHAWESLLNRNEESMKLAEDIAKILILQEGLVNTPSSFINFIPHTLLNKMYTQSMASKVSKDEMELSENYNDYIVQFMIDNYMNSDIVPKNTSSVRALYPMLKEFKAIKNINTLKSKISKLELVKNKLTTVRDMQKFLKQKGINFSEASLVSYTGEENAARRMKVSDMKVNKDNSTFNKTTAYAVAHGKDMKAFIKATSNRIQSVFTNPLYGRSRVSTVKNNDFTLTNKILNEVLTSKDNRTEFIEIHTQLKAKYAALGEPITNIIKTIEEDIKIGNAPYYRERALKTLYFQYKYLQKQLDEAQDISNNETEKGDKIKEECN